MRKFIILSAALALLPSFALALPVSVPVRVTDSAGNPVSGATFTVGGTALTPGAAATVTGTNPYTGAALTSPSLKYYDFADGTGQYSFVYDPAVAEAHFALTASKSGVTISNPTFGLNIYADASIIASTNANTVTLGTGQNDLKTGQVGLANTQAAIKAKTDTITPSPTDYQQRGVPVTLPSTAPTGYGGSGGSAPTAADIWAYGTRSLTDKAGFRTTNSLGKYTYNPTTKMLQNLNDDGTPLGSPISLTVVAGVITSRQ